MLLLGLGAASLGLWLVEEEWRFAALAGLFLAAAGLAKPEGLLTGVAMALLAILVTVFRRPLRAIGPALVLAAIVVALVPWRIWLNVHHVPPTSDYRLSDLLDFTRLGHQTDRLSYGAGFYPGHLLSPDNWLLAFPFLVVAVLLAAQRRPALAILALGSVAALPVSLLLIYWVSYAEIHYYVAVTIDRVPASAAVIAMVFTPLLLSEAVARRAPAPNREPVAVPAAPRRAAVPTEGAL
jgi:hypothetical protein